MTFWLVCKTTGGGGFDLTNSVLRSSCTSTGLQSEHKSELEPCRSPQGRLAYIGHSDTNGPFVYDSGTEGGKRYLLQPHQACALTDSLQVWWSCVSAHWLSKTDVPQWVGFDFPIGYDLRTECDREHWLEFLHAIWNVLINLTNIEPDTEESLRGTAQEAYEQVLIGHLSNRGVSRLSVDLAGGIASFITCGGAHLA